MTLQTVLLGTDRAGTIELRPDAQGRYTLPTVRLVPTDPGAGPVWVEYFACRAEGVPPSARDWAERLADAWEGADPRGRRVEGTHDIRPAPVPHPGFMDAQGTTTLRLVVDVEYFHIDPLTGREVRGIPYRSGTYGTVSFLRPAGAPHDAPTAVAAEPAPTLAMGVPADATGAPEAPLPTAGPPAPAVRVRSRVLDKDDEYLGHAAIDYGTCNSTVTLYDGQFKVREPFSPARVARLREGVLKHVLGEPYPDLVKDEWESVLALAQAGMSDGGTADPRSPAELVGAETGTVQLFRLCLLLEQRIPDCSHLLRAELATRLHRCYDAAFDVPPLEQMRLFRVELGDGTPEVSSRLEVLSTAPLTVRLGEPERLTGSGMTPPGGVAQAPLESYRGLKLQLGRGVVLDELPGNPPPTSDLLIQSALGYLVDRADRYISRQDPGRLGSGRLNDLVVTYPTVATPDVRRALRTLVSEGLGVDRVSMHFDEAVAAVMFFVMRDFGGDPSLGVEAFRARSRRLGSGRAWTQNVLVCDLGGGTCDLAMLNLTLEDTTPVEVLRHPDAERLGRHYTLTPTVQGSSGHTQLGGELLTLSVFHWLKSELADRLIAAHPERFRSDLQEAKSVYLDEAGQYRPGSLARDAHSVQSDRRSQARRLAEVAVPTCWRTAPASELKRMRWTFEQLWNLAEQAKIHLGGSDSTSASGPSPYRFGEQELSGLLDSLGWGGDPRTGVEFALDTAGFRQLVAGPLEAVAALADGLLSERLLDGERLDRVILTGKSSAMPLVRDVLIRRLGKGRDLDWDPANIEVEREYAKTATSIGAAWAEQVRQTSFTSEGSVDTLKDGPTIVRIDVDNLFFSLPCQFELAMLEGAGDRTLFGANTMLHHRVHTAGEPPVLAVRSAEAEPIQEVIRVIRVRQGADDITWGQFKCPEPRGQRGGGPAGGFPARIWPDRIRARYEITVELDAYAYFSQGDPHYTVDPRGPSIDVWKRLTKSGLLQQGERPEELPMAIKVNYTIAGSAQTGPGQEVFATGSAFTEVFHDSDAPGAPARRGLLGAEPLPESPASGEWEFGVTIQDGDTVRTMTLGRLPRPETEARSRALFVASLDEHGALRLHLGGVPFWQARDREHVEDEPGRVLRHLMTVQDKGRADQDDPFGGLQ
ncbi:Hsp70 family protein [Streptomyces sp. NPDC059010]|uniref:Hsp70 family protein n=1 Tax=Streptomyces sp. NPDC059010 TaxID=3346695 RepID=UPI003677F670